MLERKFYKQKAFYENPSIFDVLAQESLLSGLLPAFEHTLKVLAEKYPSHFTWCYKHVDELYLMLHSSLQFYYLKNYGGSFAENYYEMKRVPLRRDQQSADGLSLSSKFLAKSLVSLVLPMYLSRILVKFYLQNQGEMSKEIDENENFKKKLKNLFVSIWPSLFFMMKMISLFYYLRYISGFSRLHSLLYHFAGVRLHYLADQDSELIANRTSQLPFHNIRSVSDGCRWLGGVFGSGLKTSLEMGAFFLQFLDYFYSTNSTNAALFQKEPIPPAPTQQNQGTVKYKVSNASECPLCHQRRKQDTVLSVSGYVFCYPCILKHVRKNGTCPVTSYSATTKQLIRLYND